MQNEVPALAAISACWHNNQVQEVKYNLGNRVGRLMVMASKE